MISPRSNDRASAWQPQWLQSSVQPIDEPRTWRGVETQSASATCQVVDTWEEQELLEGLIEDSKPALPPTSAPKHFLLTTPFRYTPQHASRFRKFGRSGIWYGTQTLEAACAEVAYWRMRFILDSAGLAGKKIVTSHTFFAATVRGQGIDLMAAPWVACRDTWLGNDYAETHRLAQAAEAAGVQIIKYESARMSDYGCFAVFTPEALEEPPGGLKKTFQKWTCVASRDVAMMFNEMNLAKRFTFDRG